MKEVLSYACKCDIWNDVFLTFCFLYLPAASIRPSPALWPSPYATLIIAVSGKRHIETNCLTSDTRGLLYRHSFEATVINHFHIN